MTYFADLTPHTYTETAGFDVVNIGWLDDDKPFTTGDASREFIAALYELCAHPFFRHRGAHACWFCRHSGEATGGNGQIRVLDHQGRWYAAPTLIHHYVVKHRYLPPVEFVEAVIEPAAVGTDFDMIRRLWEGVDVRKRR